ncbi:hypothetical protein AB0M46_13595 [Dactylosporangium sp. NPDC051485]|uniref:hypothetical protein n=1 Tax=Dactylosporangium sp. NPDC051485 TaxID=3154846 RepID=UPI003425475D
MYDEDGMPSEGLIMHWNERNDHADDHAADEDAYPYTPRTIHAIALRDAEGDGNGVRLYLTVPEGATVSATVVTTHSFPSRYPGRVGFHLTSHDPAALYAAASYLDPQAERVSLHWLGKLPVVRLSVPSHTRLTLAPESVGWRFTDHDRALGGWCSWSYNDVYDLGRRFAADDWRCPERCPTSGVTLHPRAVDPVDADECTDGDPEEDPAAAGWHDEPNDLDVQETTPMPDTAPRRDRAGRTVARTGMILAGVGVVAAVLALSALLFALIIER